MDTIQFYIPFEGFYNSVYNSLIDNIIDSEVNEGYLTDDTPNNIDYKSLFNKLSRHIFDSILETFNDEFNLFTCDSYFNYEGLSSPKYYNYSTDKIMASCSNEVYLTIFNAFYSNEGFISYVDNEAKSKDGFVSFYDGFDEVKDEPSVFLEYLFHWLIFEDEYNQYTESTLDNMHEVIFNNI